MLLMGKSTISMVIFNSYVSLPEGIIHTRTRSISLIEKYKYIEENNSAGEFTHFFWSSNMLFVGMQGTGSRASNESKHTCVYVYVRIVLYIMHMQINATPQINVKNNSLASDFASCLISCCIVLSSILT